MKRMPLSDNMRRYLLRLPDGGYIWTLANTRFQLGEEESARLCEMLDQYADAYLDALAQLDEKNDLAAYTLNHTGVRLMKVDQSLCHCMARYTEAHPQIEDGGRIVWGNNLLRLENAQGRLNFILMLPPESSTFWHTPTKICFDLCLHYGEKDGLSEHEAMWGPTRVYRWLIDYWIPVALRCGMNAEGKGRKTRMQWKQAEETIAVCMQRIERDAEDLRDVRLRDSVHNAEELVHALRVLQMHFSLAGTVSKVRQEEEAFHYSHGEIDLALRCIILCVEKARTEPGFQLIRDVKNCLSGLINRYNRDKLIEKYAESD